MQLDEMEESILSLSARTPARFSRGRGDWDRGDMDSSPPRDRRASSREEHRGRGDWDRYEEYSSPRNRRASSGQQRGGRHDRFGGTTSPRESWGRQPRQPSWESPDWTKVTRREVSDLNTLSGPIIERIAGLVDAYSSSREGGRKAEVWTWSDPSPSAGASPYAPRKRDAEAGRDIPRHSLQRGESPYGRSRTPQHEVRGVRWQQDDPERGRSGAGSSRRYSEDEDDRDGRARAHHLQTWTSPVLQTDELSSSYFVGGSARSLEAEEVVAGAASAAACSDAVTDAATHLRLSVDGGGSRNSPTKEKHGTVEDPSADHPLSTPLHRLDAYTQVGMDDTTQMDHSDVVTHSMDAALSPIHLSANSRSDAAEDDHGVGFTEAETREEFLVRYCSDLEERVKR